MDSYIGKLCSIFAEAGRQGHWNRTLLLGNPATDDLVKIYLKWPAEQLQVQVTPKQAIPFFPDKLLLLSNHLKRRLALPTLNASEQFVTTRDQAFFKTLFYFGDRAGDLGQVKMAEIARFPVTMVFSLITSGEKPSAMVPRTCLVCGSTLTPPFVLLKPKKNMSPLHEDWMLVSLKVIYFALPTERGALLIGPSLVLLLNINLSYT